MCFGTDWVLEAETSIWFPANQQLYLVTHPVWPTASHGTDEGQSLSRYEALRKPGSWGIRSHSGVLRA